MKPNDFRKQVHDWWQDFRSETVRLSTENAYHLLAASAFLPLIARPDLMQNPEALSLVAGVGGNLLAEIVSKVRDRARKAGEPEPDGEKLLSIVLNIAQRYDNVQQSLDELIAQAGAVPAAQQGLAEQWGEFSNKLLAEVEKFNSPQVIQQFHKIIVSGNVGVGSVVGSGTVNAENIIGGDYYDNRTVFMQDGDTETALIEYLDRMLEARRKLPLLAEGRLPEYSGDVDMVTLPDVYTVMDVKESRSSLLLDDEITDLSGGFFETAYKNDDIPAMHPSRLGYPGALAIQISHTPLGQFRAVIFGRTPLIEIANAYRRLVLIGGPGAGKSAFIIYLSLCLAGELRGDPRVNLDALNRRLRANGDEQVIQPDMWRHGALLPIFVRLREFANPEKDYLPVTISPDEAPSQYLVDYIVQQTEPSAFREQMANYLNKRQGVAALVVLDGLDEVVRDKRVALHRVIEHFAERFPACRMIITSRPYAYSSKEPLRGFDHAELAPLTDAQIAAFIKRWYETTEHGTPEKGEIWAQQLNNALNDVRRPHLKEMASESPLVLTMMALVHRKRGRLPGGAATLYDEIVTLLLQYWNQPLDEESLEADLGVQLSTLRKMLSWLAYEVQATGAPAVDGVLLYDGLKWARQLERLSEENAPSYEKIIYYLNRRAGILMAEGGDRLKEQQYHFPHRSMQEYLTAIALIQLADELELRLPDMGKGLETDMFPDNLRALFWADSEHWREVMRWAADHRALGDEPRLAWDLVECLCGDEPPDDLPPPDAPEWLAAMLLGEVLVTHQDALRPRERDRKKVKHVRLWLRTALEAGALSPSDRAAAGRFVNHLLGGDDRPGVCDLNIQWALVPGGPFLICSTDHDGFADASVQYIAALKGYNISKYPITWAQYEPFVETGGYNVRKYWSEDGWEWRKRERVNIPALWDDFEARLANHPVNGVSWYEVVAYCNWLTEQLGYDVRLPTEIEWEKAARGTSVRDYPWGDKFDAGMCNSFETRIGRTSAVGMFRDGASPYEVLDMSGNVNEWCLTKWRKDYSIEEDNEIEGEGFRVVRGGSYVSYRWDSRTVSRAGFHPPNRHWTLGFRVCTSFLT